MTEQLPTVFTANRIAVPTIVRNAGETAMKRYAEFFAARIRNENTRAAYARAARDFLQWCAVYEFALERVDSLAVATYIENLGRNFTAPTVKQHLAAIRSLFDWLVVSQVVRSNPATAVRGPSHVVRKGKTPVREADELKVLFDSMGAGRLADLRDRAFIGILFYSFARVSAVCRMNVADYFAATSRRQILRLHEKGGKYHEVPAHHLVMDYIDKYLKATGLDKSPNAPLFQTIRKGRLTERRLARQEAWSMIKRRARRANIPGTTTCHSFRASGITIYLQNGGRIEDAALIANHESPRTTKLYDRTREEISQTEIEKVRV